ncbi:MAG: acetyl-CoA C-acyltransferase family protein [Acidiferrobacterales bacterium]|nr:acetyl-CoA C-acyltransferase family protein [Acidiferrobacterales bacterium]
MKGNEVVVLDGVRTGIGDYGGSLKSFSACELGAIAVRGALDKTGIDPDSVGHCVIGNVLHSDKRDMYISRYAALEGGLPIETPALTVNRLCGSGLQAIVNAAQIVQLGDADTVIAGGAESMSGAPYWATGMRWGQRMGHAEFVDIMVGALSDPFQDCHMGVTAENIAQKWNIDRDEQDALAVESHSRAAQAHAKGRFDDQIIPVEIKSRRETTEFATDEHVRSDCSMEGLAKMRPVFRKDGSVTAGNASGINDAAAAIVMMEAGAAEKAGYEPIARLLDYTHSGVEPEYMGIGPVPAIRKLLDRTGINLDDVDVIELNEAFAVQALAVMKDLDLPADRTNPNGSGISLGHPIGATGCILTVKALHELRRTGGRYAIVSMCIGGGQGIAAAFERL